MNNPDHQFVPSARLLRRSFALACAASLSFLLGPSTKADTILAFAQLNPQDLVTATDNGSGTTSLSTAGNLDGSPLINGVLTPPGTSVPVLASSYLGTAYPLGLLMYETFLGVQSTGSATLSGGTISQNYTGTVEFTGLPYGSVNSGYDPVYLIATFTGTLGTLSGGSGGSSASLNASEPTDTVTFTVPYDPLNPGSGVSYTNAAMSLGFSGITPTLSISGDGSIASFVAQGSGTFSASASVVPEPGSLVLASIAAVIGAVGYVRRKAAKSYTEG